MNRIQGLGIVLAITLAAGLTACNRPAQPKSAETAAPAAATPAPAPQAAPAAAGDQGNPHPQKPGGVPEAPVSGDQGNPHPQKPGPTGAVAPQ